MKKLLPPISLALLLGLGPPAVAQESRPYFYLWDVPSGQDLSGLTGYASQMVRFWVQDHHSNNLPDGYAAGQHAAETAWDQVYGTNPTTHVNHVCIMLGNFGNWTWVDAPDNTIQNPRDVSFIAQSDAVDPDWFNGDPPNQSLLFASMQPWMTDGRYNVKTWMQSFIAGYQAWRSDSQQPAPKPARFHFDSEVALTNCCDENYMYVLAAVANTANDPLDNRWNTEPVPGHFDPIDQHPLTMAELYTAAKTAYDWPAINDIVDAIVLDERTDSQQNRPYFIWYSELCQRAFDAAMNECAYTLIREAWPAVPPYLGCKVSNYGDFNSDGAIERFGWYTGAGRDADNPDEDLTETKQGVRAMTGAFGNGARYIWDDLIDSTSSRRSVYYSPAAVASGDFSAPVLYPYAPEHSGTDRLNYYLKDWPRADEPLPPFFFPGYTIAIANGRRWIESIVNSPGGSPESVAPWVAIPGFTDPEIFTWYGDEDRYISQTEFRQMLAMLRAKQIPEIMIWWYPGLQSLNWSMTKAVMDQVYIPQLDNYTLITGVIHSSVMHDVDRLRYTLRMPSSPTEEYVLPVAARNIANEEIVAIKATFSGLDSEGLSASYLGFNIECSVSITGGDIDDIRGRVYGWDPDGVPDHVPEPLPPGWFPILEITDDLSTPGFGFFAPIDGNWYETRRAFEFAHGEFVKTDGTMDLKIVLTRPHATGTAFAARFDLVQVVGAPDIVIQGGGSAMAQGADYDYSMEVTEGDADAFYEDYLDDQPAADINNDGYIDALDVIDFEEAYNPE